MGRKAEKFELNDIFGDAPNHGSHLLSASKARKYRCITSAIIAVGARRRRRRTCAAGCSTEKRPDYVHENPVLCMHEFIQTSATRFISCNFTRNSSTTRFRTAAPAEQVSNGSSWKHGSSLPTDPRVYTRLYSRVTRYARYPPRTLISVLQSRSSCSINSY
eukprot:COSAG02_NODE_1773_length_10980_cov_8.196765_10_plen_161_part_00